MQPTQSRSRAIAASNILFAGLAVSIPLWWLHLRVHPLPAGLTPPTWWAQAGAVVLLAGWYYAIRLGKPWAKYLLLVLVIGGALMSLAYHPERLLQTWRTSWLAAVSFAVGQVTQLWALVLLFCTPRFQLA